MQDVVVDNAMGRSIVHTIQYVDSLTRLRLLLAQLFVLPPFPGAGRGGDFDRRRAPIIY